MTAPAGSTNALLTSKAVAEQLNVGIQTLAKWRSEGKGPRYVQLGRSVRYRANDIAEFVERRITEPTA